MLRVQRVALKTVILLGAVTIASAYAWWSADPTAVVVQVTGSVQVQRAGKTAAAPATVGLQLNAGDKVIVGAGAKAVLLHKSGKMEATSATLTLAEPQSQQPQGLFKQAANTIAQVATTNARAQPNREGMIRPIPGEPVPVLPRNGITTLALRPTFSWFAAPGATGYVIQIRRLNPAGGSIQRFTVGKDTTWTYPANEPVLIPGAEYEWRVGVANGRGVSKPETFTVVSGEQFSQVANTLRELAVAGIDPMGDGIFVTALSYRDAGLFYEANRLLDQIAKAGAGKGRVFFMLRAVVLDKIGDLEGASRAFQAADAEPPTE